MSYHVGTPFLHLDNNYHPKKDNRKGNLQRVIEEYLPDEEGRRHCKDPDYDPNMTTYNEYFYNSPDLEGMHTSDAVIDYLNEKAENYKYKTKDGKEKKLRSDAILAVGGIFKPDSDYLALLTFEERGRLMRDAFELISEEAEKRGFHILLGTVHHDEYADHLHYIGYDDNYKLSTKANRGCAPSKFTYWLNQELPKKLAERGWDVEPNNKLYDTEYAKTLTPEEKEAYKQEVKEKREARPKGIPQEAYKFYKEAVKLKAEKEALEAENIELKATNKNLEANNKKLEADGQRLEGNVSELKAKNQEQFDINRNLWLDYNELTAQSEELQEKNEDLARTQDEYTRRISIIKDDYVKWTTKVKDYFNVFIKEKFDKFKASVLGENIASKVKERRQKDAIDYEKNVGVPARRTIDLNTYKLNRLAEFGFEDIEKEWHKQNNKPKDRQR